MTTQLRQLVDSVERARDSVLECVASVSESDASRKPADGGWSITENVEHLFLAEMSGVTKIWSGIASVRAGARWTEPRPNHGKSIEEVIAVTWKPKETAPPIATPHIGGPLAAWVSSLRALRFILADLEKELSGLNLEDIVFPHFLSGSLDGRQRLEFLRFHLQRHQAQIERLKNGA
jgi:hypothetical protein